MTDARTAAMMKQALSTPTPTSVAMIARFVLMIFRVPDVWLFAVVPGTPVVAAAALVVAVGLGGGGGRGGGTVRVVWGAGGSGMPLLDEAVGGGRVVVGGRVGGGRVVVVVVGTPEAVTVTVDDADEPV